MLDLRLAVTDYVSGTSPVKIPCVNVNHHDPTASLAVYPDHLHCFGCGFHRNDWDEALAILLGKTIVEARVLAQHYDSDKLDGYREKVETAPRTPIPSAFADIYHRHLLTVRKERLEWLYARGINDDTIREARLGHTGTAFTIPVCSKEQRLLTVRYRRDDYFEPLQVEGVSSSSTPKYSGMPGRNGLYLYGEDRLANAKQRFCFICEGEFDSLRLWQEGIPSCSATNGARQAFRVPGLLRRMFPRIRQLVVATDSDDAGEQAAEATIRAAAALGYQVYRLSWLEEAKDITEYLGQGGTLKSAIRRLCHEYNEDRFNQSGSTGNPSEDATASSGHL